MGGSSLSRGKRYSNKIRKSLHCAIHTHCIITRINTSIWNNFF